MRYSPILATLAYVLSPDKTHVLMIHRNTRQDDDHFGKYNGLGGKLHDNEDVVSGMQRELMEEAGIVATAFALCGTISWPGFGQHDENWFAFVFRIEQWRGNLLTHNDEGTLEWVAIDQLDSYNVWDGDRHFLPLVLCQEPQQFHIIMPYHKGKLVGWNVSYLGAVTMHQEP